jgi:uncharacterized protein
MELVRTNLMLSKDTYEKLRQLAFNTRRTMSDLVREAVENLPVVTPPLTLDELKSKAVPVLESAGVSKAAVFGSYARGDNRPDSDIDILIEPPDRFSLLDHSGLKIELEEALGKSVDVVTYNSIKPRIRENVLSAQIQLI